MPFGSEAHGTVDARQSACRESGFPVGTFAHVRLDSDIYLSSGRTPVWRALRAHLAPGSLVVVAVLCGFAPTHGQAAVIVVPDDIPSIQAAIDVQPDTVLVRPGSYAETLMIRDRIVVRAMTTGGFQPEVDGFILDYTMHAPTSGAVRVEGLRFLGPVQITNESTPNDIVFTDCLFEAAISSLGIDTWTLSLRRCVVNGTALMSARSVHVDSCVIRGAISVRAAGIVRIRGNALHGADGTGVVGLERNEGSYDISNNAIVGFARGIDVESDGLMSIIGNTIAGCSHLAMRALSGSKLTVSENVVDSCQGGLSLEAYNDIAVLRNRVVGVATSGIAVISDLNAIVESNVVGRCGGDGIEVYASSISVRSNTSFLNEGHGLRTAGFSGNLSRNISFRNGGVGASTTEEVVSSCNDWFGNEGGACSGNAPSTTDLTVDPLFCDLSNNDVHLRQDSPLLNPEGCGVIGALGEGCDSPTATVLLRFAAEPVTEGIELSWQFAKPWNGGAEWLERGEDPEGPWDRVDGERKVDGEVTIELDRQVKQAKRYWYRLLAEEGGGARVLGSPIEVVTARRPRYGLESLGPNPSYGPVRLEFSLAIAGEITLDVFDVQGRRVAALAHGWWPAGFHRVEWETTNSKYSASGLYLMRYRYPGGQVDRRVVLVR